MKQFPEGVSTTLNAIKCELAGETLRSSGKLRLRVMGWSMLPTVWPGDTLVIERIDSDAVSQGDIVLFGRERRLFVHRVVKKRSGPRGSILTQGDAMPQPDPLLSDNDLMGKISFILRNGKCIEPGKTLSPSERAVASLARRSKSAARVIAGIHSLRQSSEDRGVSCRS